MLTIIITNNKGGHGLYRDQRVYRQILREEKEERNVIIIAKTNQNNKQIKENPKSSNKIISQWNAYKTGDLGSYSVGNNPKITSRNS